MIFGMRKRHVPKLSDQYQKYIEDPRQYYAMADAPDEPIRLRDWLYALIVIVIFVPVVIIIGIMNMFIPRKQ